MQRISYIWNAGDHSHVFDLAFVRGAQGHPYSFGEQAGGRPVEVRDFFIGIVPITQVLWAQIMGADDKPAVGPETSTRLDSIACDVPPDGRCGPAGPSFCFAPNAHL